MSFNYETKKYEGFIYLITNSINQKQYVGQTIRDIQSRITNHKSTSKKRPYKNIYLYSDVQEYEWDNFIISEVEKISCDTLEELKQALDRQEIYYINKYNCMYPNGYNIQSGGINAPVKEIKVYQFDKLGNFIKEYKSITDASKQTNTDRVGIHKCINKKQATAGGYIWSATLFIPNTDVEIKQKTIAVYDINNVYLTQFNSVLEASMKMFGDRNKVSGISHCLKNNTKTAYGYIWKYM